MLLIFTLSWSRDFQFNQFFSDLVDIFNNPTFKESLLLEISCKGKTSIEIERQEPNNIKDT